MEDGVFRKCSNSSDSYKKTRLRKINNSSSCETHQHLYQQAAQKADNSSLCKSHVTNVSPLQGEQLRQEFVKKLIKRRVVNLWNNINDSSCDLDSNENNCHHDDLYRNHLNKVLLLW